MYVCVRVLDKLGLTDNLQTCGIAFSETALASLGDTREAQMTHDLIIDVVIST